MKKRFVFAMGLPLALSACFVSDAPLFKSSAGVQPLPAGKYATTQLSDRVILAGRDHYFVVDQNGSRAETTLIPMHGRPNHYLTQFVGARSVYYLVVRVSGTGYDRLTLDCAQDRAALEAYAVRFTIEPEPELNGNDVCVFASADSIMDAATAVIDAAPGRRWEHYERQ